MRRIAASFTLALVTITIAACTAAPSSTSSLRDDGGVPAGATTSTGTSAVLGTSTATTSDDSLAAALLSYAQTSAVLGPLTSGLTLASIQLQPLDELPADLSPSSCEAVTIDSTNTELCLDGSTFYLDGSLLGQDDGDELGIHVPHSIPHPHPIPNPLPNIGHQISHSLTHYNPIPAVLNLGKATPAAIAGALQGAGQAGDFLMDTTCALGAGGSVGWSMVCGGCIAASTADAGTTAVACAEPCGQSATALVIAFKTCKK